ncbi:MAG: YheC/YheD family protein [Symbiobacteriaceae bacterium]|nr:YheC/YheD family protein [Symbiobacteriaceae bacterium]
MLNPLQFRSPRSNYPWLYRRGYTKRPLVRARRKGQWPLWALQPGICLCQDGEAALRSKSRLFIAAADMDRLIILQVVAGEITRLKYDSEDSAWQPIATRPGAADGSDKQAPAPRPYESADANKHILPSLIPEIRRVLREIWLLYDLPEFQAHLLLQEGKWDIIGIKVPPDNLTEQVLSYSVAGTPGVPSLLSALVALLEPVLTCYYPPAEQNPWHWVLSAPAVINEATSIPKLHLSLNAGTSALPPGVVQLLEHLQERWDQLKDLSSEESVSEPKGPEQIQNRWQQVENLPPAEPIIEPREPLRYILHEQSYCDAALANLARLTELTWLPGSIRQALQVSGERIRLSRWGIEPNPAKLAILGILTLPPRQIGEPFGYENMHFIYLASLALYYGLQVVLFTPQDLDLRPNPDHPECYPADAHPPEAASDTAKDLDSSSGHAGFPLPSTRRGIWGYALEKGVWQRGFFPLPGAVYVRGVTIDQAQNMARQQMLDALQRLQIPLLNSQGFLDLCGDKLRMHQYLQAHHLQGYLPETLSYCQVNLEAMLQRHSLLILKPQQGYEARGVLRLERLENGPSGTGGYSTLFNDRNGFLHTRNFPNAMRLHEYLQELPLTQQYLIQQGIRLATWQNNPYELRLIMQQRDQQWQCMGQVIRLSGRADLPLITALRETWQPATVVLQECFPDHWREISEQAEAVAGTFSRSLGAELRAMEFAMDFLVDDTGRLWILEVNAKPASFLAQIGDEEARRRSLAAKLSYARELINPKS